MGWWKRILLWWSNIQTAQSKLCCVLSVTCRVVMCNCLVHHLAFLILLLRKEKTLFYDVDGVDLTWRFWAEPFSWSVVFIDFICERICLTSCQHRSLGIKCWNNFSAVTSPEVTSRVVTAHAVARFFHRKFTKFTSPDLWEKIITKHDASPAAHVWLRSKHTWRCSA